QDHTYRIAQILEPIYRQQDAWQKLVVIYDAELDFIEDRPRRVELLTEIARLHESRGKDGRLAFGAWARAWSEEIASDGGGDEASLYAELMRLAGALEMWTVLLSALNRVAENSFDSQLLHTVHTRIAEVEETHLKQLVAAVESWRKVASLRDDDL